MRPINSLVTLATAMLVGSASARAEDLALPSPLGIADVVRLAKARRPEITAARARASAAAQRPEIVSAFDDPQILPSIDHLPFAGGRPNWSFGVEWSFPLSHIRGNRERAAQADARREADVVDRVGLDIELDAATAFWMLAERRATEKVITEQHALADQLVAAATARYSTSAGTQADVLRAQVEVARLDGEHRAIVAEIHAAETMLNTNLARPIDAPIPELDAAVADAEPPSAKQSANAAIDRRPELRAGRAEIARAEAEVDVMKSMYSPMAMVRTGPAYTMFDGYGWMLMVGVSIPLWRGKLRAGVDEARAMANMATADLDAMRRMASGEAAAARDRVAAARERYVALRDNVVPRAQEAVSSTLSAYAASQVPLVSMVDAAEALWMAQRDLVMARAELGLAWARLARATGQEMTR